ncbi:MAG TPA: FxsA family protein [Solirubrobacteraceae bacterium]|nr:FxsA family protein [Solirubrobacteraceae bacterium]
MIFLLFVVCWIAAEVFVAIQVANLIGALATVVLLVLSWPLGSWVLRSQGRAAWRRLSAAVSAGRSPGREVLDGALALLGGVLLIIPGFISDALGVLALFPPTRALMRRQLARNLQSRLVVRATRYAGDSRSYDVDSTATDIDQPQLHS